MWNHYKNNVLSLFLGILKGTADRKKVFYLDRYLYISLLDDHQEGIKAFSYFYIQKHNTNIRGSN